MNKRCIAVIAAVLGLGLSVALVGMVGCDTPSTSEAENYFDENPYSSLPRDEPGVSMLTIDPARTNVVNSIEVGYIVKFRARGGQEPITWELAAGGGGYLDVQGNTREVLLYLYPTDSYSADVVLAYDSAGNVAVASIVGEPVPPDALTIMPSGTPQLDYDGELLLLYARGGVPPYAWSLVYPQRGEIVHRHGTDSAYIAYMRVSEPDQVIILTDSAGTATQLSVTQPEEGTSGGGGGGTNGPATALVVTVTPSTLNTDGSRALCKVSGGSGSYAWTVVDPTRGGIIDPVSATGAEVIYQRNAAGDNALKVTDTAGNSTYAIILQPSTSGSTLVATASPLTLEDDTDLALCTASGGVPPYTWTVNDPTLGMILPPNTGVQVIYRRDNAGDNAIIVTDAATNVTYVIIAQPL